MNLIIHDLKKEEWEEISKDYPDWEVVSDQGTIKPCVGCFGCWNKDPGRCVMKDGYENMGYLIHHADEVVVISRYTYGGFSSFVKNVFDRSLAYVLPHFEIINGESHHQKRYDEDKPYTFIFYGHDLNDAEKESARRYVKAVTTNMRTHVKDVIFTECADDRKPEVTKADEPSAKVVLLNASMRCANGNSAKLARQLKSQLNRETEIIDLAKYLNRKEELLKILEESSDLVICTPLYVDGLPSQLIALLELFEEKYHGESKKIYVLANMGLYESRQLVNLLEAIRQWCEKMGFEYNGALGVGAGELVGGLLEMGRYRKWPLKQIAEGMDRLSQTIDQNGKTDDIYKGVPTFPRWLYVAIANSGWKRMAEANGLKEEDLFRQL